MLNYFGSKFHLSPLQYSSYWKKCLVDLFGGGGSVTYSAYGSARRIWNDLYQPSYQFFRCVQEDYEKVERIAREIGSYRSANNLYLDPISDPWNIAASYFVYSETCFNGNSGSRWDVGISDKKRVSYKKLKDISERFQGVELFNSDFREIPKIEGSVIYADPPYTWSSRKSRDRRSISKTPRRQYFHEFSEKDHYDLREYLEGSRFILSHYECSLYNKLYQGFQKINLTGDERLWMN